jgi:protease I
MSKRVAILAEDDYEDLELWYPFYRLKEEGHTVLIVGSGRSPVFRSKHGYEVKVDIPAAEADPNDFDAVVIPGGYAPDKLRRYPAVNEFIKAMNSQGKIVAAICHAGSVLVSANILKGRKMTCYMSIRDDVMNAGARYKDDEVVVDRNLITSRFPADLPAFMRALVSALKG